MVCIVYVFVLLISMFSAFRFLYRISRKTGVVVVSSLDFCLSGRVFICSSFLETVLPGEASLVGIILLSAL